MKGTFGLPFTLELLEKWFMPKTRGKADKMW